MCGIFGKISIDNTLVNVDTIEKSLRFLKHRGPDDNGYINENNICMGMTRLAIIDEMMGKQPMSIDNGAITIVFNGEIFNFNQLRNELQNEGIKFATNSDTEVILQMYKYYGRGCIKKLEGMFAFAIYDKRKSSLWIARDRFGIKPLYFTQDTKSFVFGSTLDVIMSNMNNKAEIDKNALYLYMLCSFVPSPNTILKNVLKLEPGYYLTIENNIIKKERYWSINEDTKLNKKENNLKMLQSSILSHSISDKPIGTFLSGGIDSSIITKLYSTISSKDLLHTYSADFIEKDNQDLIYSKLVSKNINSKHTNVKLDNENFIECLDELSDYLDEPVYDSSMVASYILSKKAYSDGLRVLMAGNGADEIYGGYKRHYKTFKNSFSGSLWFLSTKILCFIAKSLGISQHKILQLKFKYISYIVDYSGINLDTFLKITNDSIMSTANQKLDNYLKLQSYNTNMTKSNMITDFKSYLLDNGLSILDKTTMAASIEGRVPYLEKNIVEHCLSHENSSTATTYNNSKIILRDMLKSLGLEFLYTRSKSGFNQPLSNLFINKKYKNKVIEEIRLADDVLSKYINITTLIHIIENRSKINTENILNIYILAKWINRNRDNLCFQ